jgi:hypothetical protein
MDGVSLLASLSNEIQCNAALRPSNDNLSDGQTQSYKMESNEQKKIFHDEEQIIMDEKEQLKGQPNDFFPTRIIEAMKCRICKNLPEDPVQCIQCQKNVYCMKCIEKEFENKDPTCPLCNIQWPIHDIRINRFLKGNHFFRF